VLFTPSRGTPYVRQRSALLRSSGPVVAAARPAATAASYLWRPSGVQGIFPSTGSTISDVRLSKSLSIISRTLPVALGFLWLFVDLNARLSEHHDRGDRRECGVHRPPSR